jgi:hypothetical protein
VSVPSFNYDHGCLRNLLSTTHLSYLTCVLPCYSNEWMAGEINHAIYLNTMCEARGAVFPSRNQNQALTCDRAKWPWPMANETGARPKHGSLYFLDYTDEQIEAMHLPAWQKPMIVAMSHYGGYVGDTGGSQIDGSALSAHARTPSASALLNSTSLKTTPCVHGLAHHRRTIPSRVEGCEAYDTAGIECPIVRWLHGQKGVSQHIVSATLACMMPWNPVYAAFCRWYAS